MSLSREIKQQPQLRFAKCLVLFVAVPTSCSRGRRPASRRSHEARKTIWCSPSQNFRHSNLQTISRRNEIAG